jgi:hypothetical protein
VVLHVTEYVVVDVTEELDFGFDAPVIPVVFQGGVVVEQSAVPTAHLVVGDFVRVLNLVFEKYLGGFLVELVGDPGRGVPMAFGNNVVCDFGGCEGGGLLFEFIGEGHVVEKRPRVVELVIPRCLELLHGGKEFVEFFITHKGEEGGIDSRGVVVVGRVVMVGGVPERLRRLTNGCVGLESRAERQVEGRTV